MGCWLHFDRERDTEARTPATVLEGGKALGKATGAGEEIDHGYAVSHGREVANRHDER